MYTTFGVYICNYWGLAVYSVALRACPPRWGEVRALDERGLRVGESRAWGKCERWMSGGLREGESRAWGKCERGNCAWVRAPPSRALCVGCAWDVRGFALPPSRKKGRREGLPPTHPDQGSDIPPRQKGTPRCLDKR